MDAEIHAIDRQKRDSEGKTLYLRGAQNIEVVVKHYDSLPFGEHKDQYYLELKAQSWEGDTESTLTARLNADDLQRIFDVALEAKLVDPPVNPRVIELVDQLRQELTAKGRKRQK